MFRTGWDQGWSSWEEVNAGLCDELAVQEEGAQSECRHRSTTSVREGRRVSLQVDRVAQAAPSVLATMAPTVQLTAASAVQMSDVATMRLGGVLAEEKSEEGRQSRKLRTVTSCWLNYPSTERLKSPPTGKKKKSGGDGRGTKPESGFDLVVLRGVRRHRR
ncbi:unnamed protein product [Linum trigynum]|uniref:Uncharacterized protein n=1 Tax=Linum trigynum TaxID=586398 RepID=A0AAV2E9J8_9ROSI